MTSAMFWFPATRWWSAFGTGSRSALPAPWAPSASGTDDDGDDDNHRRRRKRQRLDPEVVALERSITHLHVLSGGAASPALTAPTPMPSALGVHPLALLVVLVALSVALTATPSEAGSDDAATATWAMASHCSRRGLVVLSTAATDTLGLYLLDESDIEVLDDDEADRPLEFMFYYE